MRIMQKIIKSSQDKRGKFCFQRVSQQNQRLFPKGLPDMEWVEFTSEGFSKPVSGIIFRTGHPACCGVPLGGLGTGCIDIETSGVLGFSNILSLATRRPFGKPGALTKEGFVYRQPQICLPFLGFALGSKVWILTTQKYINGGCLEGCTEPGQKQELAKDTDWVNFWQVNIPKIDRVEPVKDIEYWGHFPVADVEFETGAPVEVGLRAWAPFIPGDLDASSIPGAVFEVRLRNSTDVEQRGTIAFSFPGPKWEVSDHLEFRYNKIKEPVFQGISINSTKKNVGYVLGVIEQTREDLKDGSSSKETITVVKARFGTGLHQKSSAWSKIAFELPFQFDKEEDTAVISNDGSASLAVDFVLQPKGACNVRIVLAWYAPEWQGAGYKDIVGFEKHGDWKIGDWKIPGRQTEEGEYYTAMYAKRFKNALEVARYLSLHHVSLLSRVLDWQQEVFISDNLPIWLRDCLVNSLSLIPENSFWTQPKESLGKWSFPNGAFGLVECPRGCCITGCIASNFYGDLPILYFFPELEKQILLNYREYMRPDGVIPFCFPYADFIKPTYEWMISLNGPTYVDLVDRLWQRTGDDKILRDFYDSVKQNTICTMTLVPGEDGLVSVPREGDGQVWWEFTPVWGMVPHLGGMHLSNLMIAKRMAEKMGDWGFVNRCQEWFEQARAVMDEKLWAGDSYVFYYDPKTGKKSDFILSSQLDGDWANIFHGLPGVFPEDKAKLVLETIKRTCVTDVGFAGFASSDKGAQLTAYGTFYPENIIIAMTYMYYGQREFGLEMLRCFMDNIVRKQGHPWDTPNMVRCDTGERYYGTDYFQNMILWGVPAALEGKNLTAPCRPGGLVDRILKAGKWK